ncbi:hypothetical protein BDQ17DRAFT_1375586 [Cyathus striatus]|nr:hypothetical protein BDQ17DRAFT_1375586 [Cyathus striatus]
MAVGKIEQEPMYVRAGLHWGIFLPLTSGFCQVPASFSRGISIYNSKASSPMPSRIPLHPLTMKSLLLSTVFSLANYFMINAFGSYRRQNFVKTCVNILAIGL